MRKLTQEQIELAHQCMAAKKKGDVLWAEPKRGNRGKARSEWWAASRIAERLAKMIAEDNPL